MTLRSSISQDDSKEIVSMYESGVKPSVICEKFGIHRTTLPKLYKREKGIVGKLTPYQGDMRYFQTIDTHLKAYFLGFIAADGCIVDNSNTSKVDTLAINIHEKDAGIVEKFKEELGSELKIFTLPLRNQVGIKVANQQICDDLKQYGLGYRKSLTMPDIYPLIPTDFLNSFSLGYLDGDGSIYWKKDTYISPKGYTKTYFRPGISICGTKDFLLGMANYLQVSRFTIATKKSIFELCINAKDDVAKVMEVLYKDCPFYLKRKHDKYYEVHQDQTISSSE